MSISKEKAQKKIKEKYSYLTILEFTSWSGGAKLIDSEFGEFDCNKLSNVFYGQKAHPNRAKINGVRRRQKTMEKRYGKKNAMQVDNFVNKQKETLFKNYGVTNPSQSDDIKTKKEETCFGNFGVKNPFQSDEIKEKIEQVNIEKYGTKHPLQNEDIKSKLKNTCLEKYSETSVLKLDEVKEKIKKTNIEKYGTDNAMKNRQIVKKVQNTCIKKYGAKTFPESISLKINNKTIKNIADEYGYSITTIYNNIKSENDLSTLSKKEKYGNFLEQKIYLILLENNIKTFYGHKILKDKGYFKPDFIANDNLIIECDGLYWHSDFMQNDKKYHLNKKICYNNLGYKSLFFRSDELLNKTPIVESIILAKLGLITNRIFARKCKFEMLDTKTSAKFFEDNHLMGNGTGKTYTLIYEGEIVSAMRVVNKKDHIEISRFCNRLNTYVLGGFSKLLKQALLATGKKKVVSFVDMRYGDGHSLEKLGFQEKSNHLSFKWTDFKNTYHRMVFKNNSGYEKGFFKIWDCGQKKFELTLQ